MIVFDRNYNYYFLIINVFNVRITVKSFSKLYFKYLNDFESHDYINK